MTYFIEHGNGFTRDAVNRMRRCDKLTPRLIWEHVKTDLVTSPCLIFDSSIFDKNHSHHIDLVRLRYSGKAHALIMGIRMLDRVSEMLTRALSEKALPAKTVLMDAWSVTKDMMVFIDALKQLSTYLRNELRSPDLSMRVA